MALYRLEVKRICRSKGQSAVAAAAYRACEEIVEESTGLVHDYQRKAGLVHSEIIQPAGDAPMTRAELWNMAESTEKRGDAIVAREFTITLPRELPRETRTEMAKEFGVWLVDKYNFRLDLNIHEPTPEQRNRHKSVEFHDEEEQPHAHLQATTRDTQGKKTRALDTIKTGPDHIVAMRQKWEDIMNRELKKAGISQTVTSKKQSGLTPQEKAAKEQLTRVVTESSQVVASTTSEIGTLQKDIKRSDRMKKFKRFDSSSKPKQESNTQSQRSTHSEQFNTMRPR